MAKKKKEKKLQEKNDSTNQESEKKNFCTGNYRNDPNFLDRSSLIRVYTVCHSVCIFWTHYSMTEPHFSIFRINNSRAIFQVSEFL